MSSLYWQLLVAGSTATSYAILGKKISKYVAILWTVWTILMLKREDLFIIQITLCWATYGLCSWISSILKSIEKEKLLRRDAQNELSTFREEIENILQGTNISTSNRKIIKEILGSDQEGLDFISGPAHYAALKYALSKAKESVCILSGWIGNPLLDYEIQALIESALTRGVNLYFGFGYESSKGHELSESAKKALIYLKEEQKKNILRRGNLYISRFPNHEKILIIDTSIVYIGSNNWLSNRQFKNTERSIKISSEKYAKAEKQRVQSLILSHQTQQ